MIPPIALPPALDAQRKKRIRSRLIRFFVWMILLTLVLVFGGERLFGALGEYQWRLYVVLYLALCLATGVPLKLLEPDWSAKIEKVQADTRISSVRTRSYATLVAGAKRPAAVGRRVELYLVVRTESGRRFRRKVAIEDQLDDYHVGDFVYHFRGWERILILPAKQSDTIPCLYCGTRNRADAEICPVCDYPLVKPEKPKDDPYAWYYEIDQS